MTLYEVFPDGTKQPIDVAANYRADRERWGQRTATHNAKYVLEVLSGLREPPTGDFAEVVARAKAAVPGSLSVLYAEP